MWRVVSFNVNLPDNLLRILALLKCWMFYFATNTFQSNLNFSRKYSHLVAGVVDTRNPATGFLALCVSSWAHSCSGHWFLPAARFLKSQRKSLNRMHLARDGAKTPYIRASTREEVRTSIIVDFETFLSNNPPPRLHWRNSFSWQHEWKKYKKYGENFEMASLIG